jgi:cytochrome c-type biogenesis protein
VLLGCAGFVAGFSTVFVLLGASATAVGRVLQTWRVELLGVEIGAVQVAGALIVLMGLHMTGLLPIRALYRDARFHPAFQPQGCLGTYLVGAAFAFGWSPCVGPILGGILTLAGGRESVFQGMALLGVYSLGLALPFLLAGWSVEALFESTRRLGRHLRGIEILAGALLIALGVLVATNRLSALNSHFLFLNDVVEAAERSLL